MIRISTCLMLMICLGCPVFAQAGAQNPQNPRAGAQNPQNPSPKSPPVKNGTALAVTPVGPNVTVEAVLIPRNDVNRIFGKEIGKNYAVIQLIVGNKSSDAALIIHGIFIDYSQWALSGALPNARPITAVNNQFQAVSKPSQIASEEYRVVRGQLLEAQKWTWRNVTVRTLTFLGSLAGAGTFAFNMKENQLIAALNGNLPSGVETLWPDGTVDQLNRVSDFGYQANKVIPQNGSEVIVCFFPIDRFLSPGFRALFLKSPALFFSPLEMLVNKKIQGEVAKILDTNFGPGLDPDNLRKLLPCYLNVKKYFVKLANRNNTHEEQDAEADDEMLNDPIEKTCLKEFGLQKDDGKFSITQGKDDIFKKYLVLDFLGQMSLNTVGVVVDGVMTVDTGAISSKIDGVGFDELSKCGDHHKPCFWTDIKANGGVRNGTIDGSYLTGGTVKITNADTLGIKEVSTITDGSSDQKLKFSFKLTKAIENQATLHFIITKPKTKDSLPWDYVADYGNPNAPSVTDAEFDASANTLKVTGSGFVDAAPKKPLVVTLRTPDGKDKKVDTAKITISSSTELVIPMQQKTAGCWSVQVSVGVLTSSKRQFMIAPTPKITDVKLDQQGNIVITGEGLVDTSGCDGKVLSFEFLKDGDEQGKPLTEPISSSLTKWTFPAQQGIKKDKGKVQVLLDNEVQDSKPAPAPTQPRKKKRA